MFNRLIGLTGCLRGRHDRDQAKIRKDGETFVSRCRYCGTGMRRLAKRKWVVDRSAGRS